LEKGEGVSVCVAVLRAARRGPIAEEEFAFFERLAPHLRRALRLDRELAGARAGRDGALGALEGFGAAALIADGEGRLLRANRRADALLSAATKAGGGLGTRQGRLCGPTPADTQALRAAIRACVLAGTGRGGVAPPPAALRLARGGTAEPLSVLVCPLSPTGAVFGFGGLPAALLLVHAPEDAPTFGASRLARFYGLTPAEGRLLAGLLGGQSLAEHAAAGGVSPNTAKTLLQRVFAKTGQARQSDLVRLVLSDPVSVAAARADRETPGRAPEAPAGSSRPSAVH
jgi:DNA-binding CsgD family transcriptional regulator